MAQYKVIQDIEAEDKLLGPLTLKGFIYAVIAIFLGFIDFKLLTSSGLGIVRWVLAIVFALPMFLFAVLASPLGRQQPTEVWLLGRIRFLLKPRSRTWSQSGIQHLVTVTAPKKVEAPRTKGLSETEVKSRLQTLASTLDSHGWAIKNLNVEPTSLLDSEASSDRLVAPTTLSQPTPISVAVDINAADDILDEQNNPTAKYLNELMLDADARRKANLENKINIARDEGADFAAPAARKTDTPKPSNPVTAADQAAKLELAQSGNDLSVASIANLANRKAQFKQLGPGEAVLTLH